MEPEMEVEVEVEMSPAAAKAAVFSPYSSPSTALLLQRRVVSWAKETGSPATVSVHVGDRSFNLHKDPLVSRCGYLRQAILRCGDGDGEVVELPASFPGGSEAFEVIGLYCYGDAVALDPPRRAASPGAGGTPSSSRSSPRATSGSRTSSPSPSSSSGGSCWRCGVRA